MYFSFVMYLSRKLICVACCMKLAKQTQSFRVGLELTKLYKSMRSCLDLVHLALATLNINFVNFEFVIHSL